MRYHLRGSYLGVLFLKIGKSMGNFLQSLVGYKNLGLLRKAFSFVESQNLIT